MEVNDIDGRCEYKFPLTKAERESLQKEFSTMLPIDSNGADYTISSLYFDNPDRRLYFMTHNREPYRYKLRLRVYGSRITDDSPSFFEVKSKLLGRSTKQRLKLPLAENERIIRGELPSGLSPTDERIARYILYLIERDKLEKAAIVSYERLAFVGVGEARLRATFDSNLRIRTDRLDLRLGSFGAPIMLHDECVLELKSCTSLPRELTAPVYALGKQNMSYSKYGKTDFKISENKGDQSCRITSEELSEASAL